MLFDRHTAEWQLNLVFDRQLWPADLEIENFIDFLFILMHILPVFSQVVQKHTLGEEG